MRHNSLGGPKAQLIKKVSSDFQIEPRLIQISDKYKS